MVLYITSTTPLCIRYEMEATYTLKGVQLRICGMSSVLVGLAGPTLVTVILQTAKSILKAMYAFRLFRVIGHSAAHMTVP